MVDHVILIFLYGHGGTGKNTFTDTITGLMGSYSSYISSESILKNKWGNRTNASYSDFAQAQGSRITVTDELPAICKLDTGVVKSFTGNQKITAKLMHKDTFTYQATSKLLMYGNDKPMTDFLDGGLWRRMRLIHFGIVPSNIDRNLGSKLQGEYPGILNWMIEGYKQWSKDGLMTPKKVIDDSEGYRDEMNTVDPFLDDAIQYKVGATVRVVELYAAYEEWCNGSLIEPVAATPFGKQARTYLVQKPGVSHKRTNKGMVYTGITVHSDF